MVRWRTIAAVIGMVMNMPVWAQPAPVKPEMGDLTPPDYAKPATWICRPGVDDGTCSTNLDAMVIDAKGGRTPAPWSAAVAPKIDCFYVYPTVSNDPTMYSDMNAGPEERRTVHAQAARLGSLCRLFAPIYHQLTGAALAWSLRNADKSAPQIDFDPAYRDVVAAWKSYLAHDNQGRGVVIVGHSQGAILLKRLIAEEIDGRAVQKLLVGAYLAGNTDLTSRSFKTVKPCTASGELGCVTPWSSYDEDDKSRHFFGTASAGAAALCTNPASPAGGTGSLKAVLPKPAIAPAGDPPYIELVGQLSAQCVTDATGTVLRIHIEPGPYAEILRLALGRAQTLPGWGLHILDISLVQGNMLDMIAAQVAHWPAKR